MVQQNTALASTSKGALIQKFASRFGIDPNQVFSILKQTAFRQADGREITNEQMAALLIVADQYGLNPFTKEIYAYPDKNGAVVPIVGVDGWLRIINSHPQFDGLEMVWPDEMVEMEGAKPCPPWIDVKIYRRDRSRPVAIRRWLNEVYRPPFKKKDKQTGREYTIDGPWQGFTKDMLANKGIIRAARIAFGFAGIHDEDDAEQIANTMAIDVDFKRLSAPEPEQPADLFQDLIEMLTRFDHPVDPSAVERFCQQSAEANGADLNDFYRSALASLDDFHEAFRTWSAPKPTPKPRQSKPKPAPAPEPTPPPNTTEEPPAPEPEDDGPVETEAAAENMFPDIWKPSVEMKRQIRRCNLDPDVVIPAFVNEMGRRGIDQADEMRAKEAEVRSWPDSRAKLYYESLR